MKGRNHFRLLPEATFLLPAQGLRFYFIKYGNGVAYVLGGFFCQLSSYKLIQPKYSKLLIRQMLAARLGKRDGKDSFSLEEKKKDFSELKLGSELSSGDC